MVHESARLGGAADAAETVRLVEPLAEDDHQRWADQLAALDRDGAHASRQQTLAADALHHIRAILQENATLMQQVGGLEEQVEALLSERVVLTARIRTLEERLEQLRAEHATEQVVLEKLVAELERASQRTTRAERQPIPLRPLAEFPLNLLRESVPVAAAITAAAPPFSPPPAARFQHPAVSDEETLLGNVAAPPPELAGEVLREAAAPVGSSAPVGQATSSYALIAHPFARFSDLGQFQAAVQALPSVHNVRVRRFAQGTLEMRVDYDGSAPLTDVLRGLPLAVEEVAQEDPFRLRVRLAAAGVG